MRLESWLAVIAHSVDRDELRNVVRDLCAAASVAAAADARELADRLVNEAARIIELSPSGRLVGLVSV
jgi:hypothetical protein